MLRINLLLDVAFSNEGHPAKKTKAIATRQMFEHRGASLNNCN